MRTASGIDEERETKKAAKKEMTEGRKSGISNHFGKIRPFEINISPRTIFSYALLPQHHFVASRTITESNLKRECIFTTAAYAIEENQSSFRLRRENNCFSLFHAQRHTNSLSYHPFSKKTPPGWPTSHSTATAQKPFDIGKLRACACQCPPAQRLASYRQQQRQHRSSVASV